MPIEYVLKYLKTKITYTVRNYLHQIKTLEKSMRICPTRRRVWSRIQSNPTSLVNDQATHVLGKLQDICTLLQEFVVCSFLQTP